MKLVREYLYETFSDVSDPVHDLGIGYDNLSIKQKYKIPLKDRPNPVIDKEHNIYSRGYELWKLLEYVLKAGDAGKRYSELVNYDSNLKGLTYKRRTFSRGVYYAIKRHTDKYYRKTFHKYLLDSSGYSFYNRYKKHFDDGKDFSKNK
jgi:hypothetical protein